MTLDLLGIDFYLKERLFGFWILTSKNLVEETQRSLFALYYSDGALIVDLFWINLINYRN